MDLSHSKQLVDASKKTTTTSEPKDLKRMDNAQVYKFDWFALIGAHCGLVSGGICTHNSRDSDD